MANIRKVKEKGRKLPNVLNKKQLLQLKYANGGISLDEYKNKMEVLERTGL